MQLESQVAKIQLGGGKQSSSYVFVLAEKAIGSEAELFLVAEVNLTNPATQEMSEKLCILVAETFRKSYKKPLEETGFENAIAEINDELSKLVANGKTEWMGKFNCIVAVKNGNSFELSSCGKMTAYLIRSGEFTDISCANEKTHPLKTFETFATGKIRLGDLLILSTPQMFNYLSVERFRQIIAENEFLPATKAIVQLLKESGDNKVAFASLLNLQVEPGATKEEEVDLEEFTAEQPKVTQLVWQKVLFWLENFAFWKKPTRQPKTALPKTEFGNKFRHISGKVSGQAKNFAGKSFGVLSIFGKAAWNSTSSLSWTNIKNYSLQKKIFLLSAGILLVVIAVNIALATSLKKNRERQTEIAKNLNIVQSFLSKATDSLLYKKEEEAKENLSQAVKIFPAETKSYSAENFKLYQKLLTQKNDLERKLENNLPLAVKNLGVLGTGNVLISFGTVLATQNSTNLVSFDLLNQKTQDGIYKFPKEILNIAPLPSGESVVFSENGLSIADIQNQKFGKDFLENIPNKSNFAGLAFYPDSKKVYFIDKTLGQVKSLTIFKENLTSLATSAQAEKLKNALDLAVDGNIYVLTQTGVVKYLKGAEQKFALPKLAKEFSGKGKIYTQKDYKNIYVLDTGNNRVIVLDKKGQLVGIVSDKSFTNLKDFKVDEKNKTIFLLSDSSLLKVTW